MHKCVFAFAVKEFMQIFTYRICKYCSFTNMIEYVKKSGENLRIKKCVDKNRVNAKNFKYKFETKLNYKFYFENILKVYWITEK